MAEEIKTTAEEPKEAPKQAKKKKFGPVKTSICIVSGAAVAALGVWAGIAFGRPQKRNEVDAGYGSVSYEVMEGERFSASSFVSEIKERNENGEAVTQDSGTYDAVDVFGRLNWVFAQQDNWSSEMHSTVNTAVGLQDVATYKRYADGILISSDITTSSMVNLAREFCYVGDRVMWRESEESKSQWDGINTVFSSDAPSGNMNISGDDGFRKMNGLPATELSVYVIEGNTVESAELNTTSMLADGDEVFTLTMHLLAKTDEEGKTGAAAYYGNQMVFTGGIDAPPDFKYITISYTFTEDWQVLSCNVAEEYTASMKTIVSTCSSTSETIYTYDVEGLEEEVGAVFDSYYKQYAEQEATGVVERALTAADCLASAFGSVLSGPTTLDLDLTVNGTQIPAQLYLDLGGFSIGGEFDLSKLEARLKVGDVLNLYLEDGRAYVKYSDVRISMSVDELMAMFSVPQAAAEEEAEEADILGELMGGQFTYDKTSARLYSEIDLKGIPLTLDFSFDVDSNRNVTLHEVGAKASFEGVSLDAAVRFGETAPDGLGEAEKAAYTDAAVYVGMVKDLLAADALRAEIGYSNEEIGLSLDGNVSIAYKDGFALKGDFTLGYGGAEKPVSVLFDGTAVYLDVDGVKVKAGLDELGTILSFLPATTAEAEETDVLSAVLDVLLDTKFAGLLSSAGTENALSLTVKGTELLQYFGVEYGLGEVSVALTEDGLTLTVLGATLSVEGGDAFSADVVADEYASVLPYAPALYDLFTGENLNLAVSYENTDANLSLSGELVFGMQTLEASAALNVTYGQVTKEVQLTYTDGTVYLLVDGLKLRASTDEIASLLGGSASAAALSAEGEDLLGKLLSLKFGDIITALQNSENALEAQIALDTLLNGLGVSAGDLSLGDLTVTVEDGTVTAEVLGVTLTLSAAEEAPAIPEDLDSYTDLMPIANTAIGLIENNYIAANLHYVGDFELSGDVTLDLGTMNVSAQLTLTYQEVKKQLTVLYVGDSVYLDVDGVKIRANVAEFIDLFGSDGAAAAAEVLTPVEQLLENLGTILQITNENGAVRATVALDEILSAFGYDFTLGTATLTVDGERLNVSALDGALTLTVDKGSSFDIVTDDYVEVAGAVKQLAELFQSERIALGVTYTSDKFGVNGTLTIEPATSAVHGTFTLTIDTVERKLELDVLSGVVYVQIDGAKLKGDTAQVVAFVKDILAETGTVTPDVTIPDMGDSDIDVTGILVKLLNLTFGDYLTLEEGDGVLNAVLKGTDLLRDLGITLNIGDLDLTVSEEGITAAGQGVTLTVKAGEALPAVDASEYTDLGAVIETASEIVSAQGIALGGDLQITASGTPVALLIENGGISWKDGFKARFDVVFAVDGYHHKLEVYADEKEVTVAYGTVGVKVVFADFETITAAFEALKTQVQDMIDGVTGKTEALPEEAAATLALAEGGETLSAFLTQLEGILAQLGISTDGQIDLNAILSKISLFRPATDGGLLGINIAGLSVELADGAEGLALTLKYEDSFSILGELTAAALTSPLKEMPAIDYLSTNEFVEAIGYLGAAVGLLTAQDYTFTLSGSTTFDVTEPDPEPTPDPSVPAETAIVTKTKYDVNASFRYHNGAKVPVHLDVNNQNFWIETSLLLNVHLELVAGDGAAETDKSLYLDVLIVDGAPAKDEAGQLVTDGNLDIYLSLSQFASTDPKYSPLNIYAPVDEIMTILSSGVAALGFNLDILDNYLVKPWLDLETVAQLEAFTPLISGVVGGLLEGLLPQGPEEEPVPEAAALAEEGRNFKNYIKKLSVSGTELNLTLNSADVYGVEGLENLSVTITKNEDGRLGGISFQNVYDAAGKENTTLEGTFNYEAVTPDIPEGAASYTSFLGAEKLLLSLVKSATHVDAKAEEVISGEQTQHTYAVNNNFYIDGSINANLNLVIIKKDIKIDIIAISVTIDESGALGVNIRLEYQAVNAGAIVAINGDGEVDLTIKNGMVYIKRVQKTYYDVGIFNATEKGTDTTDDDITLYRAMPIDNFMNDILEQFGFILNFNEKIMDEIVGSAGGSTEPTPEEVVDYGARLTEVLKNYTYTAKEQDDAGNVTTPASWALTLNGDALVKGILGDMNIVIAEDTDGFIHDLSVDMTVVTVIKANLDLRWRNPGGVMENDPATGKPVDDLTHDVSDEIGNKNHGMGAMIEKLNTENGWDDPATADAQEGPAFLEAKPFTVSYAYVPARGGSERTLDELTETYLVSTGAYGDSENTLYSTKIAAKDPSTLNTDEYNYVCQTEQQEYAFGEVVPSGNELKYSVTQTICKYTIRFESKKNFGEGWTLVDDGSGIYYLEQSMKYGAVIDIGGQEKIVKGNETIVIPEIPMSVDEREGQWAEKNPEIAEDHAKFTASYPASVTYKSEVEFTMENYDVTNADNFWSFTTQFTETDYKLRTPSADGYTFLGWFMRDAEGNWKQLTELNASEVADVTVEALWAADGFVTLTTKKQSYIVTTSFSAEANVTTNDGSKLVGALANELTFSKVEYAFAFNTNETSAEYEDFSGDAKKQVTGGKYTYAHVKVKVTYTIGDRTFEFEIEQHKAFK